MSKILCKDGEDKVNRNILAIAIVFSTAFFCATQCHGIVMGPARFEVSLPPGEIAEGDYYVQNDTDQPAHIIVEPENWFKDVYDYKKLGIKDWVEFDTYEFDLKPKEIKKLRLRIKVPTDVKGELVAQIFFTSDVLKENGQPSGGIKARIGSVLYVAIKGTEIVDAEMTNITVSEEFTEGKEKIKITANIKNKGNVHIRPTGKVMIHDKAGKKLAELDLVACKATLPGQDNEYYVLWDKPEPKTGVYKALVAINYGKELNLEKTTTSEKAFKTDKDGKVTVK